MTQLELTYEARHDRERLSKLLAAVLDTMRTGRWWTLGELQDKLGHTETGISARIRELRGMGFTVELRRRPGIPPNRGLFEYRLADGRFRTI